MSLTNFLRTLFFGLIFPLTAALYARPQIDTEAVIEETLEMLKDVDPRMAEEMRKITPEQKKQLEQQLNVVFDKMSEMSPEELQELERNPEKLFDFVEKTVQEEAPQPAPHKETTPSPEPTTKKQPEKPLKKPVVNTQKAETLLNNLIKTTESFLVKIETLNLEPLIEQRAEDKKIAYWPETLDATSFKEQLRTLIRKLRIVKNEMDPKTKQAVYLEKLVSDKALFNNLSKTADTLEKELPLVVASERSLEKSLIDQLSAAAKQALVQVVQTYTEALYLLNVEESINTLIKTYEPRAQEIKDEEKKLKEKARREKKMPTGKSGYVSPSYDSSYKPSRSYYDDDYNYDSYSPYSYNDAYNSYSPSSYYPSQATDKKAASKDTSKNIPGQTRKVGKKEKTDVTDAVEAPQAKKSKSAYDYMPETRKKSALEKADQLVIELRSLVRDIGIALEESDALTKNVSSITKRTAQANRMLEQLEYNMKRLTTPEKNSIKTEIAELFQEYTSAITNARTSLDTAIKQPLPTTQKPSEAITKEPAQTTSESAITPTEDSTAQERLAAEKTRSLVTAQKALQEALADLEKRQQELPGKIREKKK